MKLQRAMTMGMGLLALVFAPAAGEEGVRLEGMEERVTVTATRLPADDEALGSVPAPVTVFTREEIEASGAQTVQELLAGHASFNVFDQVGNRVQSTVALRGFSSSTTTALVVDGVRVNEPDDNRAALDLVPLADVERIEVVRGNYSSVYGGGAIGGVIHVITRSGAGTPRFEGTAALGSYGGDRLGAAGGGRFGGITYYASAGRVTSEGYRDSATVMRNSALGRLGWEIADGHRLDFSFRARANDLGAGGALTRAELEQDRTQNVFNRPDFEESRMELLGLEYRGELGRSLHLRTNLSYRSNDVDILTTGRLAAAIGSGFRTETETDTLAVTAQLGHEAGRGFARSSLAVGGEVRSSDFASDGLFTDADGESPSLATANDTDETVLGLFLEETVVLGEHWSVSGGVRYDDVELDFRQDDAFSGLTGGTKSFTRWSPRFGANFNPTPRTGLYASVARSFLAPTVNQLFAFPNFGSNPDLEPQTSTGYELGLRQEIGPRARLEANLFRIEVDAEILFRFTDPALFLGQSENIGDTRRQGVEVLATATLGARVRGQFGYTYTDATFRRDADLNGSGDVTVPPDSLGFDLAAGSRVPMVPRHKLTANLHLDLGDRWSLELRDIYVGDQRLDGDTTGARATLPSYNLLDAGVRYRREVWEAFLWARNLLDREYSTRGITNGDDDFFTPAPDLHLSAGVRFRL